MSDVNEKLVDEESGGPKGLFLKGKEEGLLWI